MHRKVYWRNHGPCLLKTLLFIIIIINTSVRYIHVIFKKIMRNNCFRKFKKKYTAYKTPRCNRPQCYIDDNIQSQQSYQVPIQPIQKPTIKRAFRNFIIKFYEENEINKEYWVWCAYPILLPTRVFTVITTDTDSFANF